MYFYKPDDDSIRSKYVAFFLKTTSVVFIIKSFCCTIVLYYVNVVRGDCGGTVVKVLCYKS